MILTGWGWDIKVIGTTCRCKRLSDYIMMVTAVRDIWVNKKMIVSYGEVYFQEIDLRKAVSRWLEIRRCLEISPKFSHVSISVGNPGQSPLPGTGSYIPTFSWRFLFSRLLNRRSFEIPSVARNTRFLLLGNQITNYGCLCNPNIKN
jgi:hypothetical protein